MKHQSIDRWRRPEVFFAEMISKSVRGEYQDTLDNTRVLHRATVVAVDVAGGKLENPDGTGTVEHMIGGRPVQVNATIGPRNPRNSIKARVLTDELDQFVNDDDLRTFWPMSGDHDSVPIKPGEHVYVMFEDEDYEHGLWIGKVAGHENVNFFSGQSAYELEQGDDIATMFPDAAPESVPDTRTDHVASGRMTRKSLADRF